MKREKKFRAWDGIRMTTSGIMFNTSTGTVEVPTSYSIEAKDIPEDKAMKLLEYTGIKDKNEKEIFEGDAVKHNDNIFIVKFTNEPCAVFGLYLEDVRFGGTDKNKNWRDLAWCNNVRKYIEVIGNIYENKELLK